MTASNRFFAGESVKTVLDRYRGIGPGFDFWRFGLSVSVMFIHTFTVTYGIFNDTTDTAMQVMRPFIAGILPVFFGLSGFLVAGSAQRTKSLGTFLAFRGLRLVPALMVEVTLSALVLGPLLTRLPIWDYFHDRHFFSYFGNIVGRVRFDLPGLFEGNPQARTVNRNLWTLHAELICYVIMALAIMLNLLNKRTVLTVCWAVVTIALAAINFATGWFDIGYGGGVIFPSSMYVYSFCTGTVAFVWRDKIPVSAPLFIGCIVAFTALTFLPFTAFLEIPLLIYIMVYVGVQPALHFSVLKKGDYSYGIYLYGFVIQQTLWLLFPEVRHWYFMFPASVVATLCFAAFSWHAIEKPALRLKKFVSRRAASIPSTTEPSG